MKSINPMCHSAFYKLLKSNLVARTGITLSLIMAMVFAVSAQTATTGQITGSVTDQSGAAVPDATITVTKIDTGVKRTATTDGDGSYNLINLPVGTYRVSVSKNGFKEAVASDLIINVASTTRQNFTMEVGQVSEVVQVVTDTVQIQTESGAVGEVVSGEQVRELPLNGRNFVQLTQLQPGVSAANNLDSKSKGLFGGVDFSVNGNSTQSNLFLTDGSNNNDTGSNRTILLFPSIEAIAEFKSLRNSYGPEYGQAAGAVISIVTRGGSNDFHGSLFYFGRNDALNATEYFANKNGTGKNSVRRHDFGGAIGGPIVKDRLFFFFSQETNIERRGISRFGSVPTLLERQGNFSQPRFAPNGRRCSPDPIINGGNPGFATQIIPAANLSQAGLTLVKIFPTPNIATRNDCTNWAQSLNAPINFREENIRIDYNLTSKHKIFGRYTQDHWSNPYPIITGNLWGDDAFPTIESSWKQPSRQAAFKLTSELGGNAINEVQFTYSANRVITSTGNGSELNAEINKAIPGYYPDSEKVNGINRPHPVFWGGIAPYFDSSGSGGLWAQTPFKNALDIYSVRDDFSKVSGNHIIKFGGLYDAASKAQDSGPSTETPQFWGPSGCCNTSAGWGNQMLADLLTDGTRFGFQESSREALANNRYRNLEFYFGDTWKVRPNLTLELGARYSLLFEPYDAKDAISSFVPSLYDKSRPASDPCNGLVVPKGTNPCAGIPGATTPTQFSNRSLRDNNYKNLAPRLGIAWDVFSNGRTAIRAGFGQFFLRERTEIYVSQLTTNAPFVKTIAGERTLDGKDVVTYGAANNGSPKVGLSPEAATPYSLQFNVSVGQQLWKDAAVEVGYVGNRARRQLTHSDVNQVLEQNRKLAAFAPDTGAINQYRPYSNYGAIYVFERAGKADYNSLQVLFRSRFAKRSQLQMAYTFSNSKADFGLNDSNAVSDFAVLDRNNRQLDYAESDINRPHIFVANMIYNMPGFKGYSAPVRTLLGGWEIATIVQISSGTSITPNIGATGVSTNFAVPVGANANISGGISGYGPTVANQRPIRVDGVPCTVSNNKEVFINPAAFTLIGYKIGETKPKKSTCFGPPTKNVDLSFYKNFAPSWLTESFLGEAARIQFRMEFFNVLNTPQFGGNIPRTYYSGTILCGSPATICSPTNNTITALQQQDGTFGTNARTGNFGVATYTRGGREIQYALKIYF